MIRTPVSCEPETVGNGTHIFRAVYHDGDGLIHGHVFPTDSLAWRAVEYGIDPSDVDTLLEIVLHEPHVPHGPGDPDVNIYAMPVEQARAHHAGHIAKAKQVVTIDHRHPVFDKVRAIHAAIVGNEANMQARAETVAGHRKQHGGTAS